MLNILYDHQTFTMQKYGGISRYFCEIIRHSDGLFNCQVGGIFRVNEYIKELNLPDEYPEQVKAQLGNNPGLRNNLNIRDSLAKAQDCDIFIPTYYDPYFLGKTEKPFVLTVHDFIHEIFPELNLVLHKETIFMKKMLIERANRIIAISENTKRDLLKFYPNVKEEKISVVYHATSWGGVSKAGEKQEKYILYTGARATYKNFPNFLEAVSPLLKKHNLKLKCTGGPWSDAEKEQLTKMGILERCSSEFASEQRLQELYANALCFAFPSLYEGFGIPILEAWACDCPLVLSNASCFPEIAKDAGVYFDPHSVEDMRDKIEQVILSESLRKELVAKGKERLKEFSWRKAAEQSAKVYEECCNEKACVLVDGKANNCKICNSQCENIFDSVILQNYNAHYFYCKNCNFLFCGNAQEWLGEAYKEPIDIEDTGIMLRNNNNASTLSLLLYCLFGNTGKFLDFAGGHGFLVRLMRDAGFDFFWADAYSQNLVARGFEGSLDEQYDAVASFESFEHFLEPMQEIGKLAKLSRMIIFSTDLLPSPVPKPNEWSYYGLSHGQHISFYSEKTLRTIAGKHNLEYISILGLHIFCENKLAEKIHSLNNILNDKNQLQSLLQEKSKMQPKTWADHLAMAAKKNKIFATPPVLFVIFNRPDVTKQVFEAIRNAKPKRLYIAGDGARENKAGEAERVMETRKIAEQVDWECEVKTLFQEKNLGCGRGVSTAINWFFENEEMGIILEDDCVPHQSFFRFCAELLERYKDNDSIGIISGDNFQRGKKWGDGSYYFSDLAHGWGWATWASRWKDFKLDANELDENLVLGEIERRFPEVPIANMWKQIYYRMKEHKIDSWAYTFALSQTAKGRIFIDPNVNLVSNIGFGPDSTHTFCPQSPRANVLALAMEFPLSHPAEIAVNHNADRWFYGMPPIKTDPAIYAYLGKRKLKMPQSHKGHLYYNAYPMYDRALPLICESIQKIDGKAIIIDIGANIGDTASLISEKVSNASILCVEGNKAFIPFLIDNAASIKNNSIFIEQKYCVDTLENNKLEIATKDGTAHLQNSSDSVMENIDTLDNMVNANSLFKKTNLLKIDTDGFEIMVLNGAKGLLNQAHPVIFFEFNPHIYVSNKQNPMDLIDLLKSCGYEKALFYDNFGNPVGTYNFSDGDKIKELILKIDSKTIYYYDILCVHASDEKKYSALFSQTKEGGFMAKEVVSNPLGSNLDIARIMQMLIPMVAAIKNDETELLALGASLSKQQWLLNSPNFNDYEFKIFSQWGDDGLIQYLIKHIKIENEIFIEFGVEDFSEANSRFLMMHNNWRGFVMDGSEQNMARLKTQSWYWKHSLKNKAVFITKENINRLLAETGFKNIGLLHIDLDGNDAHILAELDLKELNPSIIIMEYNAVFGKERAISVPYDKDFCMTTKHYSNLYWGASLPALTHIANNKGYGLIGCNLAGNNAYYVRKDLLNETIKEKTIDEAFIMSKFRQSRDKNFNLSYLDGDEQYEIIKGLDVVNVKTNKMEKL